jgi:hypothetical protein
VQVQADKQRLDLTVIDNGIGLGQSIRRSGLANLTDARSVTAATLMLVTHQKEGSGCNGRYRSACDQRAADTSLHP